MHQMWKKFHSNVFRRSFLGFSYVFSRFVTVETNSEFRYQIAFRSSYLWRNASGTAVCSLWNHGIKTCAV